MGEKTLETAIGDDVIPLQNNNSMKSKAVLPTEDHEPSLSTHHGAAASTRLIVPYVTAWSTEQDLPMPVIGRSGFGIGYADEIATDRDVHGVLWHRTYSCPTVGRPVFGDVHSLRQRRAMRKLLCQVCGGPADKNDHGVLWLLPDHSGDWNGWPEAMGNVEPPICLGCVEISLRLCPKLRRDGGAAIRVREYPIVGVRGARYAPEPSCPVMVADEVVAFDDPAIRWVRAAGLVRQLHDCTIVPVDELLRAGRALEGVRLRSQGHSLEQPGCEHLWTSPSKESLIWPERRSVFHSAASYFVHGANERE